MPSAVVPKCTFICALLIRLFSLQRKPTHRGRRTTPGVQTDRTCIFSNFQNFHDENKFVFAGGLIVARVRVCSLVRGVCEGLSICGRSERDSIGMRRERLRATLRGANAEIQPGTYFGLFDCVDNLAPLVGIFIVNRTTKDSVSADRRVGGSASPQARGVVE